MRSVKPKLTTRGVLLSPALFALALLPRLAAAQEFEDVQPSTGILALKQQGSFFIGGNAHAVPDPYAGVGAGARPGNSMINQMYVQFQKPARSNNLPPIVFVHGCCLSSKTWETTPDGRMGWYEYFTRNGFDTYMADQVGRARSGFDALHYQKVRYDRDAAEFTDDGTGAGCVNGASPPGPNPAGCLAPGDARGNPVFPALPGKTGTANEVINGQYSKSAYAASFIGFVPANKPQLLVAIMVDRPQGAIYGGSVAAPAFQKIVGWAVPFFGINPR